MSKNAEMLKSYVPYEIQNSNVFNEIFNSYGQVFDKLGIELSDLLLQILPQTATEWGLSLWEKRIGIQTNTSKTIEERRARILAKLRNKGTTTVEVIKQICRSFASEVEVIQHNSDYYFEINLLSGAGFPYELESMYEIIETIKPAHLNVNYKIKTKLQSNLFVASGNMIGEKIKVYPWVPKKIESEAKIFIPINNYIQLEKVTVYPKKEGR
ncbi:putative phage tail protein [Clostridium saccharoperbutylacetonicum]|uniref:putative phage tail protein n=1 Tax=Clostridium saccharoperbutylacetonicum TaxID=36745 RepID=UPI0039EAF73A